MKYYAIPDLHGRYDLLSKAINTIVQHAAEYEKYTVITLGDYIDRGPQSKEVIDYLMEYSKASGVICLQGNHEAMAVECITHSLQTDWWIGNGGDATFASYGWGGPPYNQLMYEMVPKTHFEWMRNLPLYYETEKQVFVHAGIPQYAMNLPPKKDRMKEELLWMLYDSRTAGGWKGKHVVHGHHQSEANPQTWHGPNGGRTALDTWAYHTGRLVIGVFDDTQGPAKEYIEIKL